MTTFQALKRRDSATKRASIAGRGRRAAGLASLALCALLGACASPPKPATPDGAARVPVNDPARIQRMREGNGDGAAAAAERAALTAQVAMLQDQLGELREAVRKWLSATQKQAGAPGAASVTAGAPRPAAQ